MKKGRSALTSAPMHVSGTKKKIAALPERIAFSSRSISLHLLPQVRVLPSPAAQCDRGEVSRCDCAASLYASAAFAKMIKLPDKLIEMPDRMPAGGGAECTY
jgi:hypothetical protein